LPFGDQYNARYREVVNPLGLAQIFNRTNVRRTLTNLYGEVRIVNGLTYRASFNIDLDNQLRDVYSPRSIVARGDLNANSGSAEKYNSNATNLLHESILTYTKTFADAHSLKFTGVFATQGIYFNRNQINVTGFPNDVTRNEAVELGANRNVSSLRTEERLDSYMGRLNYGFRDKLFVDLTARADGASKFGANNKYGFFPAASAAWRIIQEPFMQGVSFLSDLKLRASYGLTGNAGAIDPYQSLALVAASTIAGTNTPGGYTLNNVYATGISPSRIPNRDLGWEQSTQADLGLDVGLFGDRLSLVVDVYNKRTDGLLFVKSLPLSSGYATITGNFAEIRNRGLEISADARILDGNVKWSVNGNLSVNRNELLSLPNDQQEIIPDGAFTYSILQVGQPVGIFRTYVFDGIYQADEPVLPGSGSRTGGVKVRDVNGDGQITTADQIITGNANANFIFGFSTNLSYKGFDLAAFLTGVQGNDVFNQTRYLFENALGARNVLAGMANRWSPGNPSNEYASGFQGGRLPISNRFMEDGSFMRLRNITLGYTLPQIKGLYRARLYVSGNNLVTLTRYTGYDPEVNTFGGNNVRVGIDNGVYPLAKSFIGGLQVTF
jgi:TonB-linked SusC/RagA family outer membrane protein